MPARSFGAPRPEADKGKHRIANAVSARSQPVQKFVAAVFHKHRRDMNKQVVAAQAGKGSVKVVLALMPPAMRPVGDFLQGGAKQALPLPCLSSFRLYPAFQFQPFEQFVPVLHPQVAGIPVACSRSLPETLAGLLDEGGNEAVAPDVEQSVVATKSRDRRLVLRTCLPDIRIRMRILPAPVRIMRPQFVHHVMQGNDAAVVAAAVSGASLMHQKTALRTQAVDDPALVFDRVMSRLYFNCPDGAAGLFHNQIDLPALVESEVKTVPAARQRRCDVLDDEALPAAAAPLSCRIFARQVGDASVEQALMQSAVAYVVLAAFAHLLLDVAGVGRQPANEHHLLQGCKHRVNGVIFAEPQLPGKFLLGRYAALLVGDQLQQFPVFFFRHPRSGRASVLFYGICQIALSPHQALLFIGGKNAFRISAPFPEEGERVFNPVNARSKPARRPGQKRVHAPGSQQLQQVERMQLQLHYAAGKAF